MNTCEYAGDPFPEPRSHPWLGSASDSAARYYDLTESPHLIRSALEDFVPWARYSAIEAFYALVQRLNHAQSALETNDCAFIGPHPNDEPGVPKALLCSGRLMVLFRALEQNTTGTSVSALKNALHRALAEQDSGFAWGLVGTTLIPTRYLALPERANEQLGSQLMISFWAWGDGEADTMKNLERLFTNLSRAFRAVARGTGRS